MERRSRSSCPWAPRRLRARLPCSGSLTRSPRPKSPRHSSSRILEHSGETEGGRAFPRWLRCRHAKRDAVDRDVVRWVHVRVNEQLDWLVPYVTAPEGMAIYRRLRERCDTILLGRVNYEGFHGYWPPGKDDPKASGDDADISRWLDDVPKVVFSRTLREVTWKNARLAEGSAPEEVAAL